VQRDIRFLNVRSMRLINTYTSDFAVRLMQPAQKPRAWVVDDTRVVIGRTGTRET